MSEGKLTVTEGTGESFAEIDGVKVPIRPTRIHYGKLEVIPQGTTRTVIWRTETWTLQDKEQSE